MGTNLVGTGRCSSLLIMTSEATAPVAPQKSRTSTDLELVRFMPIWNGILHEFRNQLTVLLAAATEVRTATPPSMAPEMAEALLQSEASVEKLNALVAFVDAAIRDGAPAVVDLDDVIERALLLSAPALGGTSVSFMKPHPLEIRNRGTALECLISGLMVELARAEARGPAAEHRHQIDVHVNVGRDAAVLEIESNGRPPAPGSWRIELAADLASRIGATVTAHEPAGFLVRLP